MTDKSIRVAVLGALGRMGTQVCSAVSNAADLQLVAALDQGDALGLDTLAGAEVLVDFTNPTAVMDHIRFAVQHGVHAVVGTSGFTSERLAEVAEIVADRPGTGVLVVPNFAIGAVLATKFAAIAARFFESAEIVELHHAGKLDAPSGTAIAAAHRIAAARGTAGLPAMPDATRSDPDGARGATLDGVHVHAVRMPGLVAHLELMFGSAGEILTIRHDSLNRSSFMPGVLTAIRAVVSRPGLTVGLEPLISD